MKVDQFIEWLQTQPQHLEVCVVAFESGYDGGGDYYERTESACFDDPHIQSTKSNNTLTLGVEG